MRRAGAILIAGLVAAPAAAAGLPPLDSFSAMVERPLFAPDRRAAADPRAAAAGVPRLLGIARDARGRAVALIGTDGRTLRALPDERIGGWRLVAVRRGGIDLAAGERRRSVAVGEALPP
jgi:hypothetical protein